MLKTGTPTEERAVTDTAVTEIAELAVQAVLCLLQAVHAVLAVQSAAASAAVCQAPEWDLAAWVLRVQTASAVASEESLARG